MKKIKLLIIVSLIGYPGLTQNKKLKIGVDERIELITTIQLICNSSVMTLSNADIAYTKEVTEKFGRFINHPAVITFDSLYYKYFNFEMPFELLLHYSLPHFRIIAPIKATEFSPIRNYKVHADSLSLFMIQLKDFYIKSHFHEFFLAHQEFYDSLRADVTSTLENKNIIPILEKYYGKTFAAYDLILSPLSLDGGFGITVKNKDRSYSYAIIGPAYTSKVYPEFKKSKTVVIHEMSHPFSNPVIDAAWSELKKDTCLYRPVIKDMQKEGYWGWMAVVYETLNRANEVILTAKIFGETESKALYNSYISKKYLYLPLCIEVLKNYNNDRKKFPVINSIKEMLIQAFEMEMTKSCR